MIAPRRRTPPVWYCSERPLASASMVWRVSSSTSLITCQATTPSTSAAPMALRPRMASVSLNAVARNSLTSAVTDHVSGAAHRVQQGDVEVAIDLGAQARDVDVDDVGLRIEMIVPDVFEQHGAGDDLAGVLQEVFEQAEFARLQRDLLAGARHLVGKAVEREVAEPVHRLLRRALGAAARQRLDAGEQLGKGVGFGEIVVAAGAQALDAVVDLAERREDQRRRLDVLGAQRADQRQSVHLGQ